ncbi:MAG: HEAT repeat domain-containing protein [Fimbriimonadaceae bacterium]
MLRIVALLAITSAGLLITDWGRIEKHTDFSTQNSLSQVVPWRMESLTDFKYLNYANDKLERLEILVRWLAEEKREPSEKRAGLGGGPIDSGYIQQQLIRSLAGSGADPRGLRWLASSPEVRDPEMKLACKLALGLRFDQEQKNILIRTLERDGNPNHRLVAAFGLGNLDAQEARSLLKKVAKSDPFHVNKVGSDDPKTREFPVRVMAEGALRMLDDPVSRRISREQTAALRRELADSGSFVKLNAVALRRIVVFANRSLERGGG